MSPVGKLRIRQKEWRSQGYTRNLIYPLLHHHPSLSIPAWRMEPPALLSTCTPEQRRQTEAVSCDKLFKNSQVGTSQLTPASSLFLNPEFFPSLNNQATFFPNHHHRDVLLNHSGDLAISLLRNLPWVPTSSVPTFNLAFWIVCDETPNCHSLLISAYCPSELQLHLTSRSVFTLFQLPYPFIESPRVEQGWFKVVLPCSGMKLTHGVWLRGFSWK